MRRVLIITYYWPSTGGSGVQRWVKFAKYLPALGWQPVVYTPSNPEQLAVDDSLLAEIPAEVEVLKQPIREPYALYHKLMGRGSSKGAGVNPINAQKKNWKQRLMLWVRSNFFVPDPRAGWVRPSVGFLCRYLSEHPVDMIVTTGPPQSVHLIGRGLHRALGVPWVADFRDPWTRMFFFENLPLLPWVRRRHFKLEKSVLDEATAVVSVTPRVQADFASMTSTPVHLITNGYDESDFAAELPPRTDGKFRIVHTGLFASDGNPLELWNALAGLCSESTDFASRLEIRLAGKVDPEIVDSITEAGLGAQLRLLGYLPHPESVAELRQADIILLPLRHGAEYSKVYPGKIFECMAAGPAVLGIGPTDSAAAELLISTGTGVMFDWSENPAEFIRTCHSEPKAYCHSEPLVSCHSEPAQQVKESDGADGRAAAYSRKALAGRMAILLTSLTK
ncbi:MAG: glycosyltransferase [Bacteroidales bacterium]|nr:glycosyltransferase [Bacteroidales bacterium]